MCLFKWGPMFYISQGNVYDVGPNSHLLNFS